MVNVVAVAGEGRAAGQYPAHHDGQRVENRQAEQEQRQRGAQRRSVALGSQDRQHAYREAEHLAAPVAHEHACGVRVEAQEPENRARLDQRNPRHGEITRDCAKDGERAQAKQSEAAGETIQAVGKIDGIRDSDQEHEGQRPRQHLGQHDSAIEREPFDAHIADDHAQTDGEELTEKLEAIVQVRAVVPDTKSEQHEYAAQEADDGRIQRRRKEGRNQDSGRHCDTAYARNRRSVHLASTRRVGQPNLGCPTQQRRRTRRGDRESYEGCD